MNPAYVTKTHETLAKCYTLLEKPEIELNLSSFTLD